MEELCIPIIFCQHNTDITMGSLSNTTSCKKHKMILNMICMSVINTFDSYLHKHRNLSKNWITLIITVMPSNYIGKVIVTRSVHTYQRIMTILGYGWRWIDNTTASLSPIKKGQNILNVVSLDRFSNLLDLWHKRDTYLSNLHQTKKLLFTQATTTSSWQKRMEIMHPTTS